MPWVRLHAIKGYFDMIDLLQEYPEMKVAFNLVPSLIKQLLDYAENEVSDPFLDLTLIPAGDLTPSQKYDMLYNFFMAHWSNMIKPHPRYWELLVKRGFKMESVDLHQTSKFFQTKDFRDLQAWANLAWFGYRSKKKFPEITELIQKGKDFTDPDIQRIIALQKEIIRQVIPSYQEAWQKDKIELTTSPFYHPILPLVYNTDFAKRCLPQSPLPKKYSFPEDAQAQIQKAIQYFEKVFHRKPTGLWPSEGSVCPELIPLLSQAGIQWIATDEEILSHSVPLHDKGTDLFKAYEVSQDQNSVNIFFRDRGLSDLIGFTYSQNSPQRSAEDFLKHLHQIQQYTGGGEEVIVPIILDGENAWEHYPDGGEGFLRRIYDPLSQDRDFIPTTFTDYLKKSTKRKILPHLHTGSWIHHDFDIWIGSEEENTAWEYLGKTREFVKRLQNISDEEKEKILEQIYIAQGSDWFWWYGDDFSTDNDEEFDRLFRLHLEACYKMARQEIPEYLSQSILGIKTEVATQKPIGFIQPAIDGKNSHFYEWHEAGLFLAPTETAMHRSEKYINKIFFGFDLHTLYLRIDPFKLSHLKHLDLIQMNISLTKPHEYKIVIPHAFKKAQKKKFTLYSSEDGIIFQKGKESNTAAFEDTFEFAIPFTDLNLKESDEVKFRVSISQGDMVQEIHPKFGWISFTVPTKDFEMEMWSA